MFFRISVGNIFIGNVITNRALYLWFNSCLRPFNMTVLICMILFFTFSPSVSWSSMFIGGELVYRVTEGDTLELIGAKLGVDWQRIRTENNIREERVLSINQEIRTNTRKIVPKTINDGIIINIPDRMLYYFKNGTFQSTFPVGLGRLSWETPTGQFRVVYKEENPTWYVPRSVQKEMLMKGEPVKSIVPPGPKNPLGRYAVKISIPGILIHETIWPSSVYQFRSHGCIRVLARDMEKFFKDVDIHEKGEIIYSPLKIAISDEGRIFFEVHRDVYKKVMDMNAEARRLIESKGISEKVNWRKVNQMLNEKSGIAEDITL